MPGFLVPFVSFVTELGRYAAGEAQSGLSRSFFKGRHPERSEGPQAERWISREFNAAHASSLGPLMKARAVGMTRQSWNSN